MAVLGGLLKVPQLLELHELGSHARRPTPSPVPKLLGAINSSIPSDEGLLGVMSLTMRSWGQGLSVYRSPGSGSRRNVG